MPWTSITASTDDIDDEIASFESGVTSIDDFSVGAHGMSQVTAVIQYTA
jgi:hypothetical protein